MEASLIGKITWEIFHLAAPSRPLLQGLLGCWRPTVWLHPMVLPSSKAQGIRVGPSFLRTRIIHYQMGETNYLYAVRYPGSKPSKCIFYIHGVLHMSFFSIKTTWELWRHIPGGSLRFHNFVGAGFATCLDSGFGRDGQAHHPVKKLTQAIL